MVVPNSSNLALANYLFDSVHIPFNGRKRLEVGISAKGGLTNKILGYIATQAPYRVIAT